MPLIVPRSPGYTQYESNVVTNPNTSTLGTTVSNPGSANTKNTTWTTLIAATSFDTSYVIVTLSTSVSTGTDTGTLLDIGIGAAASETVVIPDLLAGHCPSLNGAPGPRVYHFPLYIPAGERISARTQSVRTTGSVNVTVELFGSPSGAVDRWVGQQVTAYGINTADSGGTAVTAGNSGAETASPVSMGSTTSAHRALVVGAQGSGGITAYNALAYFFDLGIDTSSTTWLVRDYYYLQTGTNESVGPCGTYALPVYAEVPSGTTLVIGGECSGTAQALDFAVYGVS